MPNKTLFLLLLCVGLASTLASCAERTVVTAEKGKVSCAAPPKELDNPQVRAEADIIVPKIGQLLKGNASAQIVQQRVRQELHPKIANWEVIDYRLCLQYASGVITADQYHTFTSQVLDTLKEVSPSSVTQTTIGASSPAINNTKGNVDIKITNP